MKLRINGQQMEVENSVRSIEDLLNFFNYRKELLSLNEMVKLFQKNNTASRHYMMVIKLKLSILLEGDDDSC